MKILDLIPAKKYLAVFAAALLLVLPACKPAATPTPSPTGPSVTVDLAALNLAFDKSSITVPAGYTVTIVFDNKEAIPHNFALYENLSGGQTKLIFASETFTGPAVKKFVFPAPPAGKSYTFYCDVHPATMSGTFIVQ